MSVEEAGGIGAGTDKKTDSIEVAQETVFDGVVHWE